MPCLYSTSAPSSARAGTTNQSRAAMAKIPVLMPGSLTLARASVHLGQGLGTAVDVAAQFLHVGDQRPDLDGGARRVGGGEVDQRQALAFHRGQVVVHARQHALAVGGDGPQVTELLAHRLGRLLV